MNSFTSAMKTERHTQSDCKRLPGMVKQNAFDYYGASSKEGCIPRTPRDKPCSYNKNDTDQTWERLCRKGRKLKLQTMDFSDLWDEEDLGFFDEDENSKTLCSPMGSGTNPPILPPPPPPPVFCFPFSPISESTLMSSSQLPQKDNCLMHSPLGPLSFSSGLSPKKKTRKLHWTEINTLPSLHRFNRFGEKTIWATLEPLTLDTNRLEDLFELKCQMSPLFQRDRKKQALTVLDFKRSNIVNIALTSLPPLHIIQSAVLNFDECVLGKEEIEKLLSLMPTEEELQKIKEAQKKNPGMPLASAEQFLQTMSSIDELSARLHLWAFKLDYDSMEKEIAEVLYNLKQGMEQVANNKTFKYILATLLAIGNFLNGCKVKGFDLEYLEMVPQVKDTVYKKPLLYHICNILLEIFPESTDFYSEIPSITKIAKVDFAQLHTNLVEIETRYNASKEHHKVVFKHDSNQKQKGQLSRFLKECAKKISVLKAIYRRVLKRFHTFLMYFAYPSSAVHTVSVSNFCKLISDFALEYHTTRAQILQTMQGKRLRRGAVRNAKSHGSYNTYAGDNRHHERMKEILSTPERTRRYDTSLPRTRSKQKKQDTAGRVPKSLEWLI
ncbi:FH1/FH2 domain-containing protein 3-like [Protopterus annectens]|uniref:FH1/FH2 domain-containing protein 3-like n=1 Tax=Protopterus annectens TaxID=7888 RepID=UPI001CFC0341|nr:FH1/FH2 domain-containing protein 3-like [Protopterus annectens]